MSKYEGRRVTYAVAHGVIHVPFMGQIGPTLGGEGSVNRPVKMTIQEPFILLEVDDKTNRTFSILVPLTNFSHILPAKEDAKNNKA